MEQNLETMDIELTLEEWGEIALIAHKHDLTINQTIVMCLERVIEEEKQKALSAESASAK